ncbi:MAG: hypothetical protein ACI4NC_06320 [Succinivibrio sp.]
MKKILLLLTCIIGLNGCASFDEWLAEQYPKYEYVPPDYSITPEDAARMDAYIKQSQLEDDLRSKKCGGQCDDRWLGELHAKEGTSEPFFKEYNVFVDKQKYECVEWSNRTTCRATRF